MLRRRVVHGSAFARHLRDGPVMKYRFIGHALARNCNSENIINWRQWSALDFSIFPYEIGLIGISFRIDVLLFPAVHDVRWDSTWLEIVECSSIGPCRSNSNAIEK
jgi:hypothetical protein